MPSNFRRGPLRPQEFFKPWIDTVAPVTVAPGAANLILTTFAPTVSTPIVVRPAVATLVLTGFAPTVATPRRVTPASASLVLTGYTPTLTVTTNVRITPAAASLTLTGYAPIVSTEKLAEGGPYVQEPGWHRRRPRIPESIPAREQVEPTVVEIELPAGPEPEPIPMVIDNRAVIAALHASGIIDEEEFAALIAA